MQHNIGLIAAILLGTNIMTFNTKTASLIAFFVASLGAQAHAAGSYSPEIGPEIGTPSAQTVDRAQVLVQLNEAKTLGLVVRGEIYPASPIAAPAQAIDFRKAQSDLRASAVQRAEAERTGKNGYTRG
jgi:hypothetical protein